MQYLKNKILNFYLLIALAAFFLDRLFKIYVIKKTEEIGTSEIFFSNYLNIQLVWNEGIAFGLLAINESNFYNSITFLISIVIIILIYFLVLNHYQSILMNNHNVLDQKYLHVDY